IDRRARVSSRSAPPSSTRARATTHGLSMVVRPAPVDLGVEGSDTQVRGVLQWEESRRNLLRNWPEKMADCGARSVQFYRNFSTFDSLEALAPRVLPLTRHGHVEHEPRCGELPGSPGRGHGRARRADA